MGRLLLNVLALPRELIVDFFAALTRFHQQEDDLQSRQLATTRQTGSGADDLITRSKMLTDIIEQHIGSNPKH